MTRERHRCLDLQGTTEEAIDAVVATSCSSSERGITPTHRWASHIKRYSHVAARMSPARSDAELHGCV